MPWNLVLSDQFTGTDNDPPDPSKWATDIIGASSVADIIGNTLRLSADGSGSAPDFSRAGVVSTPGLPGGGILNARLDLDVFVPQTATGIFTTYGPRFSTTQDDHYYVMILESAGNLAARLQKTVGGTNTSLTSDLDLGAALESIRLRIQVVGNQLKAAVRAISAGVIGEGDWDLAAVDTSLEVSNPLFLRNTKSGGVGADIFVDDVVIRELQPTAVGGVPVRVLNSIGQDGGTSVVLRVLEAVPAGATVFVQLADADPGDAANNPTCADSQANTYVRDLFDQPVAGGTHLVLFRASNITALAAGDTITVSGLNTTGAHASLLFYVEGLADAGPVASGTADGSSATPSTGSVNVTQGNVLVVGALATLNDESTLFGAEDASYSTVLTHDTLNGASNHRAGRVAVRHLASGANISYAPTLGASQAWVAGLAAYALSAASGGFGPLLAGRRNHLVLT